MDNHKKVITRAFLYRYLECVELEEYKTNLNAHSNNSSCSMITV